MSHDVHPVYLTFRGSTHKQPRDPQHTDHLIRSQLTLDYVKIKMNKDK